MLRTEEAVARLREIKAKDQWDQEVAHLKADQVLLDLINNAEVAAAYDAINKWYA